MCTVTLVPLKNGGDFTLTSNRDEGKSRPTSPPNFENIEGKKVLFPKDELAAGTWIGISERKRLLCLLNGEFKQHKRQASYRKSRGLLVKEWLVVPDVIAEINENNLEDIEPFTLIILDWHQKMAFFELVWDGKTKHFKKLDPVAHIWSSSPLYSSEMKAEREKWFKELKADKELTSEDLWEFHHTAGLENKESGLIIDRQYVRTQSITQINKLGEKCDMIYEDLDRQKAFKSQFIFN